MKSSSARRKLSSVVSDVSKSLTSANPTGAVFSWKDLEAPHSELRLDFTLANGQYFSWKKLEGEGVFVGVIDSLPIALRQTDSTVYYKLLSMAEGNLKTAQISDEALHEKLRRYFHLHIPLKPLYEQWSIRCDRLAVIAKHLPGVRIMDQDPWECIVGFITSSNNNIKRITQIIDRITRTYGTYLCSVGKQTVVNSDGIVDVVQSYKYPPTVASTDDFVHLYSFPSIETLSAVDTAAFREMGLGYRAEFMKQSSEYILRKGGREWLLALKDTDIEAGSISSVMDSSSIATKEVADLLGKRKRSTSNGAQRTDTETRRDAEAEAEAKDNEDNYRHADSLSTASGAPPSRREYIQQELMKLHGVGRKVADCIALFSLRQTDSIPVDTHVFDIAVRDYLADSKEKETASIKITTSLTPKVYNLVGNDFRKRFGIYSGWAHTVLFSAELNDFKKYLPIHIVKEMEQFANAKKKLRKK